MFTAGFSVQWFGFHTYAGPEFKGEHFPPTFGQGGHNIFYSSQYFVIKINVVVQISWYDYCWKTPA